MSLNGLDDAAVTAAYQGALAEAGGWFLLQYASRDEVKLLARGTGGVAETRAAIAENSDKAPLYGFLLYRRRKVLIKYIPADTSRLIQARVAVHFQTVSEQYSPHDTVFTAITPEDLSDTALSAACCLHTASASIKSFDGSTSRSKLDEITEDAEESPRNSRISRSSTVSGTPRPSTAGHELETAKKADDPPRTPTAAEEPAAPSDAKSVHSPAKTENEHPTPFSNSKVESILGATASEISINTFDFRNQAVLPRLSSQSMRPSTSELYAYGIYGVKPKVKLGPRPSTDRNKRPHTSGPGAARPVSTLPAGLRIAPRRTNTGSSRKEEAPPVPNIALTPTSAPVQSRPPPIQIPDRPVSSGKASIRSAPPTQSQGMTREKQRLLKAMEMRKKQLSRAAASQNRANEESPASAPAVQAPAKDPMENGQPEAVKDQDGTAEEAYPSLLKADSGVGIPGCEMPDNDDMSPTPRASLLKPVQRRSISADAEPLPLNEANGGSKVTEEAPVSIVVTEIDGVVEEPVQVKSDVPEEMTKETTQTPSDKESSSIPINGNHVALTSPQQLAEKNGSSSLNLDSETSEERRQDSSVVSQITRSRDPSPSSTYSVQRPTSQQSLSARAMIRGSANGSEAASEAAESESGEGLGRSGSQLRKRRRGVVPPIKVDVSVESSLAGSVSDDSLIDELHAATVEEAKPMSVSKSPITPYFSRRPSANSLMSGANRSVSNPALPEQAGTPDSLPSSRPMLDTSRSSSAPHPVSPLGPLSPIAISKKVNVSSGISKRIQALAEKSNQESVVSSPFAPPTASTSAEPANSIVAMRKSSLRSTGNLASAVKHAKRRSLASLSSLASPSQEPPLPTPTLPVQHRDPPQPRDSVQTVYNISQRDDRPESVSVTARIVRDSRSQKPDVAVPTETTPLELHHSPIVIERQTPSMPPPNAKSASSKAIETPQGQTSTSKDQSNQALPRSSSESTWRKMGRRQSETKSPPPSSTKSVSSSSLDNGDESREEKKSSRTSRILRRMSATLSGSSRKNTLQSVDATLKEDEQESDFQDHSSQSKPHPSIEIGDLNVQFPDTLLWKRRWVEVDGQGNIVLGLARNEPSKGTIKRYHMSEFRAPFAPDQDRQEMPNSVILDFLNGSTLQCACQDSAAQTRVLQILQESYRSWVPAGR